MKRNNIVLQSTGVWNCSLLCCTVQCYRYVTVTVYAVLRSTALFCTLDIRSCRSNLWCTLRVFGTCVVLDLNNHTYSAVQDHSTVMDYSNAITQFEAASMQHIKRDWKKDSYRLLLSERPMEGHHVRYTWQSMIEIAAISRKFSKTFEWFFYGAFRHLEISYLK